jgi:cytochrome P450 family 142 subfamily A polypeptide 1
LAPNTSTGPLRRFGREVIWKFQNGEQTDRASPHRERWGNPMSTVPSAAPPDGTRRPQVDFVNGRTYAAADLHAALHWMRLYEPFYHDTTNDLWAVTRHADIMAVSKRSDVFRNAQGYRPDAAPVPHMIAMDRPEHIVRRNLVNSGFTPRRVAAYEGRVREICTEILDDVAERGECELVFDVAARLPLMVIGDLLGVDPEDYDQLLRWSDDLMRGLGSDDEEKLAAQAQAGLEYREYCLRVVADRRVRPATDDLMSVLVHAEIDGERLDDESLFMESLLILIGGDETTRHVISGGAYQLLLHPEQFRVLREDPTGIPRAVEEMLRWVSPIQNMMRTAASDANVGDHHVQAGDRLLMIYPSGNRDEEVFDEPFRFDVRRDPNPHVAFGGRGAHYCLGASLARLELRVMFEELLRRLPDLELATSEPPPLRPANFVVGIERLPVRFSPTRKEALGGLERGGAS